MVAPPWDVVSDQMVPPWAEMMERQIASPMPIPFSLVVTKASKQFKDRIASVAAVFSQMRASGVPFGMTHPDLPNISSTLWRTVFDHDAKRYYFDSAVNPSVVWLDLDEVDVNRGARSMKLRLGVPGDELAGDVYSKLEPVEPFGFLAP